MGMRAEGSPDETQRNSAVHIASPERGISFYWVTTKFNPSNQYN
jgi:hypothetical protein